MITKEYSNGEVTILWKPEKCIHSGVCVKTLPMVYNPKERPWIKPENASSEDLIRQVGACPSGALSIKQEDKPTLKTAREDNGKKGRFVIYENEEIAGEMTYVWAGESRFIIDHTEVGESYGGRGLGQQLVAAAVDYARSKNLKILPLCPFAKKVFDKSPEYADVLN